MILHGAMAASASRSVSQTGEARDQIVVRDFGLLEELRRQPFAVAYDDHAPTELLGLPLFFRSTCPRLRGQRERSG